MAVIDRRQNKKDGSRDVIEKRISIVKDIDLKSPHRAHIDILCDMALTAIKVRGRGTPTNFRDLYDGWMEALSAQALNSRFYRELSNWYLWATKKVEFPSAIRARENETTDKAKTEVFEAQNQIAVIRLLTRLIFVWFIKEKGLVPASLFDPVELKALLVEDPIQSRESSTYYKAVLQNLFFATLNTEMGEGRKWRKKGDGGGLDGQYLIHSAFRYQSAFSNPDAALEAFRSVPFLNGGLFECLDREIFPKDLERDPDLKKRLVKEGSRSVLRIDGFSERSENPLKVPNEIFFASKETVDLNAEYGTKGKVYETDGLIELFSRYKFTVEENTPVEEEVALDPELLGKVFENLLASYNTDTRTTARKKSGSFYTPREVVDYMVDEALIAFFKRDVSEITADFDLKLRSLLSFQESGNPFASEDVDRLIAAIDNLKALDPACGSGAFPMGLLQKLIHVLHRLDPDNSRWKAQNRRPYEARLVAAREIPDPSRREAEIEEAEAQLAKLDRDFSDANKPEYARKLYLIDKCLFGVDIQPIAVQIAKLRFFISLVVSQEIDENELNKNITPLPNLETKLVAANSLIPIDRPVDMFRNPAIKEKEAELESQNARHFSARTAKTKRARREAIAQLRDELSDLLKSEHSLDEADARMMAAWDPFDQNSSAPFFDPEWMFGLQTSKSGYTESYRDGPFDLVIGNPPYVRQEEFKDQKPILQKVYGGKDKNGNPLGTYAGTADLLVYFIQRGFELLKPGGAFAYITSNKWYRAKYGQDLRRWVNKQATLLKVLDFGDADVFDAAAYPTILVATRREDLFSSDHGNNSVRVMNWPQELGREDIPGFPKLVDEIGFDMPQKALAIEGWQLEPQAKRLLLERIRAAGMPLGQYVEKRFYRGILTGFNEAFIIDGATREKLIAEHASSEEVIKPFLRGRDIKRWHIEPQDLWLIYIPWHFPLHLDKTVTGASVRAEELFKVGYPAVYAHLERFKEQLWARNKVETGIRYEWYALQRWGSEFWEEFERPKIVVPAIQNKVDYAPDLTGCYSNDKTSIIVHEHWAYLLAVLNSPVSWWITQQLFASKQGGFYEFKPMYVANIPIPSCPEVRRTLIEGPVSAIVAGASDNRLEQLLNGFVYELFFPDDLHARGLTLFEEAERAGLERLAGLEGVELTAAATDFANTHLVPGARLRTMLSDLATLDVVRIIEGRE
ncbi:MAG: Eco57I restriction-modification methylase domain-containing protein [Rhodocyclaceae bacterium]|nr:Eco57I restriction-modification methylase domain-containing protein [Rhodocyclaceae bacterium]